MVNHENNEQNDVSDTAQDQNDTSGDQITVRVARLTEGTVTVTGRIGMNVAQALWEAGIELEDESTLIRGTPVGLEDIVSDHDLIVVAGRVKAGLR